MVAVCDGPLHLSKKKQCACISLYSRNKAEKSAFSTSETPWTPLVQQWLLETGRSKQNHSTLHWCHQQEAQLCIDATALITPAASILSKKYEVRPCKTYLCCRTHLQAMLCYIHDITLWPCLSCSLLTLPILFLFQCQSSCFVGITLPFHGMKHRFHCCHSRIQQSIWLHMQDEQKCCFWE